jgi:transcriptional regulator CtsR
MAKISDLVEALIKQLIEQNNGVIEITRSELADRVNCVPSQINYVLSTRFTNARAIWWRAGAAAVAGSGSGE